MGAYFENIDYHLLKLPIPQIYQDYIITLGSHSLFKVTNDPSTSVILFQGWEPIQHI